MDMYKENDTLKISIKNLPELRVLTEQAEKEAQQLQHTLNKLSCFTINIEFNTDSIRRE